MYCYAVESIVLLFPYLKQLGHSLVHFEHLTILFYSVIVRMTTIGDTLYTPFISCSGEKAGMISISHRQYNILGGSMVHYILKCTCSLTGGALEKLCSIWPDSLRKYLFDGAVFNQAFLTLISQRRLSTFLSRCVNSSLLLTGLTSNLLLTVFTDR